MDEIIEAGRFTLHSFKIASYDLSKVFELKGIIHSFQISESITKGSIRGFAKMFDTVGLLQEFPLRGEEFIEIHYSDFYGNEHVDRMFLYAIADVRQPNPSNPSQWEYTMHFVSRPKVFSENVRIRRAFAGPPANREQGGKISEFVKTVYDQYYGDLITPAIFKNGVKVPTTTTQMTPSDTAKELKVQDTDGRHRLVVPNYSPEQTMNFFARRAFSGSSFSQSFRFFENRKHYVFATNEHLQNEIYSGSFEFRQSFKPDQTLEGQLELQSSIIEIDYGEVVNTIDDINSGAYERAVYEVDVMNSVIEPRFYSYADNFKTNNPDEKLYHTDKFIRERIEKVSEKWVLKDYSTEGMPEGKGIRYNTHYSEIYNKKGAHLYHTNKNRINVTIYGNNEIVAGSSIVINLLKHFSDDTEQRDIERSGLFLVESIENVFYENTYKQKLTLIRNGIGDAA